MRRLIGCVRGLLVGLLLLAAPVSAQVTLPSPVPASVSVSWMHDGLNTTEYLIIVDNLKISVGLPAHVNTVYTVPLPAALLTILTPGTHTLLVVAHNIGGDTLSDPLTLTVTIAPPTKATQVTVTQVPK